jgi:glycosyltransferase involved in cell wall biosynthesis
MKIIHIITTLNDGGAEATLMRLCEGDVRNIHIIISLSDDGKYGPLLKSKGFKVYKLNMSSNWPSPIAFLRLMRLLKSEKPHIVQTWLYHADLLGGLTAFLCGINTVVWGIHNSMLDPNKTKKKTFFIIKILAKLSWILPSRIVVCAESARIAHSIMGYNSKIMHFIPNGYDLSDFKYLHHDGIKIRNTFNISKDIPLLGTVGRYDPYKDHSNLLHALALVKNYIPEFKIILVGSRIDYNNSHLIQLIKKLNLENYVLLLGPRNDIPSIMSALDLHILSSSSEGFPNVVAEAMACETPCIVTDVGDASFIIGDTGWVVPPQNYEALAVAIRSAITEIRALSWSDRCAKSRYRILSNFSIENMVKSYNYVWNDVVKTL